jgi:hypothetical protein
MHHRTRILVGGLLVALALLLLWMGQYGWTSSVPVGPALQAPADVAAEKNLVGGDLVTGRSNVDAVLVDPDEAARAADDEDAPTEFPALPEGSVDVLVQQDGVPITGGFVHLKSYDQTGLPEDPWNTDQALVPAEIGSDGIAHFINVGESNSYRIGVEWPRTTYYAATRVFHMPDDAGARVTIDLGSGRIVGTVYGVGGVPVPGIQVNGYQGSREYVVKANTDANGEYAIEHAAPGVWMMTVEIPATLTESSETTAPAMTLHAKPVIEDSVTQRVDFGRPGPWPTWRGSLVDRAGLPVPNRGPRQSSKGRITLYDLDFGTTHSFPYRFDGSFEFQVPVGTYTVKIKGPINLPTQVAYESFSFPAVGSTQDIVLPGISLRGTVLGSDGRPYSGPHAAGMQVSVLTEKRDHLVASVSIGSGSTYVLPGLAPGRYFVNTLGVELVQDQLVELAEDSTAVTWDITVKEP